MAKTRKELATLTCVPCRGGIPPLETSRITEMMNIVPGWTLQKEGIDRIEKVFKFKNFKKAMIFVNKVADIANEQDHHPDIFIHWNEVTLTLYTHAIKGLHDNDFIIAAKIDELQ
ncbi:MAG: 4a-hydroxytetrahydrobiopterin dehydratase [Candidatus Thorarchaeota archaeon]|jgi:4a-hydroxytetrahydrobiopterin dehydratase